MDTKTSPSDQIIKNLSLLYKATEQGIIDIDRLKVTLSMEDERRYLEKHDYKIWQGKTNKCWYTRIEGKLIKRAAKENIEKVVIDHYKQLEIDSLPSIKSCFNEWIDSKQKYNEVKDNSICRYQDDYKRYIKGTAFEKVKMSEIDDFILDDYVRSTISKFELTSKGWSGLRTIIIGTLKYAKRMRYTDFSVSTFFSDFQISKSAFKRASAKKRYIYSKAERASLYEYLMSNPTIEHLGLALMCLTGLRVGELAALKLEDNTSSCHLYVHRTETREFEGKKRKIAIQDTAKMGHDDTIILPKAAQRVIDITKMRTHRDEYLFSVNGRRITAQTFRRHLKNACEAIGIDYRPPHQMRKTYASILLSEGTDEAIIKREMRHTDIATTRAYYQYITADDDEEKAIIDAIAGL